MSWSSITVTTKFSFTDAERLRPVSPKKTTMPKRISTRAMLMHSVRACKLERLPALFLFFPIFLMRMD